MGWQGSAVRSLYKTVDVRRDHLFHRKRSPFPYEGKDLTPLKISETCNVGRNAVGPRAGTPLPERRRGEAHRRQGWVGGVYPSAPLKARTAASDGRREYPRACA